MFKFAFKNMAIKKAKIVLIVISIVISACVGILAYNISEQVDSGFKTTAAYYDMIIGPSGSSTQLAMNPAPHRQPLRRECKSTRAYSMPARNKAPELRPRSTDPRRRC